MLWQFGSACSIQASQAGHCQQLAILNLWCCYNGLWSLVRVVEQPWVRTLILRRLAFDFVNIIGRELACQISHSVGHSGELSSGVCAAWLAQSAVCKA